MNIVCRQVKTEEELQQCFEIRLEVFVKEQGLFAKTDIDEIDMRAIHIAAFFRERVVGTVRVYEEKSGTWWGGRLAVRKRYRGKVGRMLIQKAVETVKGKRADKFFAYVQVQNEKFFKTLDWKDCGDKVNIHGQLHCLMEADLS